MENESKGNNSEQMFVGGGDRNVTFREKEWYRQKAIDMIYKIDNEKFLNQIHTILKKHIEKRGG